MVTASSRLYRPREVAELLQVSPETVRAWLRDGLVEHITLPRGDRRIPEDVVEQLLARTGGNAA